MSASPPDRKPPDAADWLVGGGEMGKLVRSMDWSRTPLGPIESWPQSLRTAVSLCLASNFPISLAWGPGRVQIYNDGYWPICGGKHPMSMGQDFKECWSSAWPAIGEAFESASAGQTAFLVNRRMFLDRHGYLEETFFTFSFSPIRDEAGGVGGLFHPVTELTQQTLAERRLQALRDLADRTSEAKTLEKAASLVAEALGEHELDVPFVLLYLLDEEGRTAHLAGSAGLASGTAVSPELVDLGLGSSSPWPFADVVASGQVVECADLTKHLALGACGPYPEPPTSALVIPIHAPGHDHPLGLLIAGVSSRRELDQPYRTFYVMLRESVTNALLNARAYEEERKRAEALAEIDRAKTAFFSNVSHEFRTPLTLMLAPLEDVLGRPGAPVLAEHHELLTVVHRNGLRLQKLVNTLLDFSRIEAGRVEAVFEPTDLGALTAELASNFRSACERAGVRLVTDCPPLGEPVYVDRDMWEKIVLNLLSNAFKFTFEGEIAVILRRAGHDVELTVRDTGTGIPAGEIPRLFERFYRVKDARARTHEGTGIGLSLVQELVRFHGGSVRINSMLGQGSTFTVTIPGGKAHLPPQQIGAQRVLAPTSLGASPFVEEAFRWLPVPRAEATAGPGRPAAPLTESGQCPRILWVDDNADMRDYVSRLLREHWTVDAVADGKTALAVARAQVPDLVLADVMMPGLDGFGLLRALRQDPRTSMVPVILLSARAGEEARVEGLDAGADDYVVKPFTARELIARIGTHLTLAQARRETARQAQEAHAEAEAASRAKDVFLAMLSHELRQPMNSIVGWVRILRSGQISADVQGQGFETLERNVHTLTRLIDDLLDVSSIMAGKIQLTLRSVDLRSPIEAALEVARPAATDKGVMLEALLDPLVPRILGDPDRLQQVVWNLLSNAVKFTPSGGRVAVRLRHVGASVVIEVTDSGAGIKAEFLPRIFDPFNRAAEDTTRATRGLGLGLSIVRYLVQAHGGTVSAESPGEGLGSTFTVRLPAAPEHG